MDNEYLLNFLKEKNVATIKKKKHTYLTYYGLEQQDTYVLKDGIVKTSVILPDGREFNISYINTPDILSLLRDQVSQYTSAPFNVRVESDVATFYRIPRVLFWDYVSQDKELQDYVNSYYREKLSEAIFRQHGTMSRKRTHKIDKF
jgi:CRP-like cAMP-binding protein